MKKNLLVFASLLLLFSCSDEKLSAAAEENVGTEDLTERSSYNVTYDDAVNLALSAPEMFKTAHTKGGTKKIGECLPILSAVATKGGSLDTLMYLINYADNQGYTFIPKDARKGTYIAFVDNGSFNLADTASSDLVKFLYRSIVDYCKVETAAQTKGPDATYDGVYRKYAGDFIVKIGRGCTRAPLAVLYFDAEPRYSADMPSMDDYYRTKGCIGSVRASEFVRDRGVDPLLTTSWGQTYPFNEKAPLIKGERAVAGCVATAITQVIAYHSFPSNYPQGTVIDGSDYSGKVTKLDVLKRYRYASHDNNGNGPGFRDYVSQMYRYVGDAMNNSWGLSATGAYTSEAPACFKKLGYSSAPSMVDYAGALLSASLDKGWPVIVRGSDSYGAGGHAWVVDGYRYLISGQARFYIDENGTLDYKSRVDSNTSVPELYVNCNYGWNGNCNGFYISNVFDTDKGPLIETKYNFVGTQMIVNIHP